MALESAAILAVPADVRCLFSSTKLQLTAPRLYLGYEVVEALEFLKSYIHSDYQSVENAERVRQLRCGMPQQLQHHQARTQLPEGLFLRTQTVISNDRRTARGEAGKRRWYLSEIASSVVANSWRTASRLEMYSKTKYCEGRVVFLAKDFPDAGCRIDSVRGRTAQDGSSRGLNRLRQRGPRTDSSHGLSAVRIDLMSFSTSGSCGRCEGRRLRTCFVWLRLVRLVMSS